MKTLLRSLSILLLLGIVLTFTVQPAQATSNCPTVSFTFTHRVDGTKLGLSQALPVIAEVYFGPNQRLVASIPLEYQQNAQFDWTHGLFTIKYFSVELNQYVDSLQVGPETFERCTKVGLHSKIVDGVPSTLVNTRPLLNQ